MFRPTRYLEWARRHHGRTRFDLATSGVPVVDLEDLAATTRPIPDADAPAAQRTAIARYNGADDEEAVAALGTTHALWLAYTSLVDPGDEVLVESPAYEPLVRIAEGVGAHVTRFERARDDFAVDPDRVAAAMTSRTRVVAFSRLHNPTGARASDASIVATARVAAERGAYVVVDEVYAPFDDFVDEQGVFSGTARRLAPNVVAVSSLTKCYGLGPERIGWVLAAADVVARANDVMTATLGMLPIVHARRSVTAFENVNELARRARACLAGKRDRVDAWVRSRGLAWTSPGAGTFGFVHVPGRGDLTAAIESAATEYDVLVAPGAFFGCSEGFRISWPACGAAELDEGLARLTAALDL